MKLLDFKTPTGQSGNLLSPSSWVPLIVGTVVLIIAIAIGQNGANAIGRRFPMIDTQVDPLWRTQTGPSAPAKEVY